MRYKTSMTLKAVIHKSEDGGFWAEVPSLPGCYSQGETVEELLTNLREAAQGCLEVLREEGRSPEPEVEIAELAV
jgi:predicted RNase H-like HicB family nuclease